MDHCVSRVVRVSSAHEPRGAELRSDTEEKERKVVARLVETSIRHAGVVDNAVGD